MENSKSTPEDKDPVLWKMAQKRAGFKSHFFTYLVVNAFFWAFWYFTGRDNNNKWPWPVWPMLGWGIGLLFHFFGTYVYPEDNAAEREYEKLVKRKQQQ